MQHILGHMLIKTHMNAHRVQSSHFINDDVFEANIRGDVVSKSRNKLFKFSSDD